MSRAFLACFAIENRNSASDTTDCWSCLLQPLRRPQPLPSKFRKSQRRNCSELRGRPRRHSRRERRDHLIGTIENKIESQTHPPIPMADEWQPRRHSSRRRGLVFAILAAPNRAPGLGIAAPPRPFRVAGPHLNQVPTTGEASDIERVGQNLYERLNTVVGNLHGKLEWPQDEPVAELVLADYIQGYGPEVWQLTFNLKQEMQRMDYYDTQVSHPAYLQSWPPEKGQPHTLIEFQYPPEKATTTLLDLLRQKDPRIEKICASDAKMREVADRFLEGQSGKILAADATQFLRAALAVMAPQDARQTMAIIGVESGFDWILRPPPEPKRATYKRQTSKKGPPTRPRC